MLTIRSAPREMRTQRGLSLVELLVGVAIGLMVLAGAATVVAAQLTDSRKLILEAQVQQDLRASADIIARQLRRAGYWSSASSSVWFPGAALALNSAPSVSLDASSDCPTEVTISLSGSAVTGFRLNAGPPGVILQKFGASPAQELTDKTTVSIEAFCVGPPPLPAGLATPPPNPAVTLSCPARCPDGTQNCWPTMQPQELMITITGRSLSDPSVVRTIQSTVRVRNDQICTHLTTSPPLCDAVPASPPCPS